MDPYFAADGVTLYLGDCREVTEWLAADVLVTDPPYGRGWKQGTILTLAGTMKSAGHDGIAGDADTSVRDEALSMWGDRPAIVFGDLMLAPPAGTKQVGIYKKPPDAGQRGAIAGHRRDVEALYWLGGWPAGIGGRSSVYATGAPSVVSISAARYRNDTGTGHPHAKPGDVMEQLVTACPPGVIADPFAGCGSTLIAARNLGRKAVGVEIDERYAERAALRLCQGVLEFA